MQLNVSGHHVEVTESMRDYVGAKIDKIARHFDIVSDVQCILTVEKLEHLRALTAEPSTASTSRKICTLPLTAW